MGKIHFRNNGISNGITDSDEVKRNLKTVFKLEEIKFQSVDYVFSTDTALLKLNQKYLKHNTLTDIITFTLSGTSMPLVAEIYISVERVLENAKKFDVTYLEELHRVMIHGVLHLCGYSDHTPRLKSQMRVKENFYLNLFGFL